MSKIKNDLTKLWTGLLMITLIPLIFLIPSFGSSLDPPLVPVIISVEKTPENLAQLRQMQPDILMDWEGKIYIVAFASDLLKLRNAGISFADETHKFLAPFRETMGISTQTSRNGPYHSYAELERDLFALQESYPNLAKVFDIGNSHEMRTIYALKISDNVQAEEDENEAEVVILGCHHAREWISVEVPFYVAVHLLENYSTDAHIRSLVNQSEVWIVPLVNPDGLEYSIHFYRYWRKNMRDNQDSSFGVDTNRNYGYKWGFDDEGSSPDSSSYVYRGPGPFSEPETKAVRDLVNQRNFQVLISYHNYSQVILYPWGYTNQPTEMDELLETMASGMSRRMQAVNGRFYGYGQGGKDLYLTNGGAVDWAYGAKGIPAFTIELPPVDVQQGAFITADEAIEPIVNENIPALLYIIEWAILNRR